QPSGSPSPEAEKRDRGSALELPDQEGRDQVPRQCEEGVDAEEAAWQPGPGSVRPEHGEHGEGAYPIEPADPRTLGRVFRHDDQPPPLSLSEHRRPPI